MSFDHERREDIIPYNATTERAKGANSDYGVLRCKYAELRLGNAVYELDAVVMNTSNLVIVAMLEVLLLHALDDCLEFWIEEGRQLDSQEDVDA